MNAHRGFTAAGAVVACALLIAPPLAARVRVTTATDSGGPASALLACVDDADAAKRKEQVGIPLSFVSWRSFQGEATDPVLCSDIARAIRRGVAEAGPGLRSIQRE